MSAPVLDDSAPAGRDAVVRLEGIVTRFGRNVVHEGVDLSIRAGEIVALVGGSGSGKTTLLRHVIGLTRPAAGEVEVFGEALDAGGAAERLARQRRMGVLFQHGALFSAFSVAQNIAFPLRELGVMSRQEIDRLVALKLEMVEMEAAHALLMPAELSGGMVKRVALARALALEPELLLLDEPTAGLDAEAEEALLRSLRATGVAAVVVSHRPAVLAEADRVVVIGGSANGEGGAS